MFAVEKNPNAYLTLLRRVATEWGDAVEVINSDMRDWKPEHKADIIISGPCAWRVAGLGVDGVPVGGVGWVQKAVRLARWETWFDWGGVGVFERWLKRGPPCSRVWVLDSIRRAVPCVVFHVNNRPSPPSLLLFAN